MFLYLYIYYLVCWAHTHIFIHYPKTIKHYSPKLKINQNTQKRKKNWHIFDKKNGIYSCTNCIFVSYLFYITYIYIFVIYFLPKYIISFTMYRTCYLVAVRLKWRVDTVLLNKSRPFASYINSHWLSYITCCYNLARKLILIPVFATMVTVTRRWQWHHLHI